MSIDVGTRAPDFTLMSHDRQKVTLSAHCGAPIVPFPLLRDFNTQTIRDYGRSPPSLMADGSPCGDQGILHI